MHTVMVLNSRDDIDTAIAAAEKQGLRWAAASNAGTPMGWVRLTFLPASAFKAEGTAAEDDAGEGVSPQPRSGHPAP